MIPGSRSKKWTRRLSRVESKNITYASERFPVFWERAQGSTVWDVDGNAYLDLTSAFGVASLGHAPAALRKAASAQLSKMWHGMGDVHPNAVKVELLELLAKTLPGKLSVSILSSSGAEAVESALKTAKLYTQKPGVLFFDGAYHGLTYGTLALSDREDFRKPFVDQLNPHVFVTPYPDSLHGVSVEDALGSVRSHLQKNKQTIGAIVVEPFQGRGGVRIPPVSFLKDLRQLATEEKVLLIFDEIWTGFGRTGELFAANHAKVVPDLMCLGKALSNGFPLSVCVGTPEVMKVWPLSNGEAIHTSTYLGNPLGCAMALASIQTLKQQKLVEGSRRLGRQWKADLQKALGAHPQVAEIRGEGLMIGIELKSPTLAGQIVLGALQEKVLLLSGGKNRNVLSLTPPLVIREAELKKATRVLRKLFYGNH